MKIQIKNYFQKVNPLNFHEERVIRIIKLGRGESNINFLINTNKNKYLMRFDIIDDKKRFKHEFDILQKLESSNISQKPLHLDLTKKYFKEFFMILSYIEGESLDKLKKRIYFPHYRNLAKKLAKLHKLKFDFVNKTYSFEHRLTKTENTIKILKRELGKLSEKDNLSKLIDIYNKELKRRLKTYTSKLTFCHGDFCGGNILFKDKEFFFIDWEGAGRLDPAIELSYHLYELPYNKKQREMFLKEYLTEREDRKLLKRMEFSNFFVAFSGYFEILRACFDIVHKRGHKEYLESADFEEYWEWGNYYLDIVCNQDILSKTLENKLKKEIKIIHGELKSIIRR